MCRVVGIAHSGYYAWRRRDGVPSAKRHRQVALDYRVASAFHRKQGRSGSPRLKLNLKDEDLSINRKTVAACLRHQDLRARAARRFKVTTNSRHGLPVAPNLLQQDCSAVAPNQKWVGDITYLWTDEGWLYLAVLLDLYSRRVIGWTMRERMTAELVADALQMALWNRRMPKNVIIHGDRGSQYCSVLYRSMLTRHDFRCSMRAKGIVTITPAPRASSIASRSKPSMASASILGKLCGGRCSSTSSWATTGKAGIM